MGLFLYIFINVIIVGLFLYSKLLPYKVKLTGFYLRLFNFFESILNPLLMLLRKIVKPVQVGNGLAVDMSQIILLVLFLLTLKIIL
jgi:hypothetical protein